MNDSKSKNTFRPKQAMEPSPEHYNMLVGDGMQRLAEISLSQCPPIPADSKFHDNGCGTGASTAAIMAICPVESRKSISVTATDILQDCINAYQELSKTSLWPANAQVMDSNGLSFPDESFTHSLGSALLFTGPSNDGRDALKEMYRTLKPGGYLIVNSLAHTPTLGPIAKASQATRPEGTPVPRQDLGDWERPLFLTQIVEAGGFQSENIITTQCEYFATTPDFEEFPRLLWSFIGGTTSAGWTQEDEIRWDEAVNIVKEELKKSQGFKMLGDGTAKIRFVANVAIARK